MPSSRNTTGGRFIALNSRRNRSQYVPDTICLRQFARTTAVAVHYLPIAACDAASTAAVGRINTARRFPMMDKTKLAFAVLLLLQIAPAAQAASRAHHHATNSARSAY